MLHRYIDVILRHDESSNVLMREIFTYDAPISTAFLLAQEAFCVVMQFGSVIPTPVANAIDFSGEYSHTNFDEIKIDCLVKLTSPAGSIWTRDPASESGIVYIRQSGHEPLEPASLPCAFAPAASTVAAVAAADAAVAAAGATPLGGKLLQASEIDVSTSTALHYSPGSAQYVIGETYGPLNLDEPGSSTPIQKLLKLERILCVIQAKDAIVDAADIRSRVLGVVLIGPSMDSATCAAVFDALSHYKSALQRLWALSEANRLFAIRLQPLVTQQQHGFDDVRADVARVIAGQAAIRENLAGIRAEVAAARAVLAQLSAKLEAKDIATSADVAVVKAKFVAEVDEALEGAATTRIVLAELVANMHILFAQKVAGIAPAGCSCGQG